MTDSLPAEDKQRTSQQAKHGCRNARATRGGKQIRVDMWVSRLHDELPFSWCDQLEAGCQRCRYCQGAQPAEPGGAVPQEGCAGGPEHNQANAEDQ